MVDERHHVAIDYNWCLHVRFEQLARKHPDRVCLYEADATYSFAQINNKANQMARHLKRLSPREDPVVAILVERGAAVVIGMLAALKAGGAFLLLDSNTHPARLREMIQGNTVCVLIVQSAARSNTSKLGIPILHVDSNDPTFDSEHDDNLGLDISSTQAACAVLTSGSTGSPKCVLLSHQAFANRLSWMWGEYPFENDEVCCQRTPLNFVDAVTEILVPLLAGVPVVILDHKLIRDPREFVNELEKWKITRVVLVPSLLRSLLKSRWIHPTRLRSLRYWISSGDILHSELVSKFRKKLPNAILLNLYGSSEVAGDATCCEVTKLGAEEAIPVGRPIANTKVYIVDKEMNPVPTGVVGELCVSGPGVAMGYANDRRLTEERFLAAWPGGFDRIYRTGDLGRYREDGQIQLMGRADRQVKIRGVRVQPEEIERLLIEQPQLEDAMVVPGTDTLGETTLRAFVVLSPGAPSVSAIQGVRAYLRQHLPEQMIPSSFTSVEGIPRTEEGKPNWQIIHSETKKAIGPLESEVAQLTPLEASIAGIWSHRLGLSSVGIHDRFVDLGGDSLLAVELTLDLEEAFDIHLPVAAVFDAPTISQMAPVIQQHRTESRRTDLPNIRRVSRRTSIPLTMKQEVYWGIEESRPGQNLRLHHNIELSLRGQIDVSALAHSLNVLVRRHESLRTNFRANNGIPFQVVIPESAAPVELIDMIDKSPGGSNGTIERMMLEIVRKPFDLSHGPILRAALFREGDTTRHRLLLVIHHIQSDGSSMRVLVDDLLAIYFSTVSGQRLLLPKMTIQYPDFAHWQRNAVNAGAFRRQIDYWEGKAVDARVPAVLPSDMDGTGVPVFPGPVAIQSVKFPDHTTRALSTLARSEGCTPFMVLLGVFYALIFELTGVRDITVSTIMSNRSRTNLRRLIGLLINFGFFRATMAADSFRHLLHQIKLEVINVLRHEDCPNELISPHSGLARGGITLPSNILFYERNFSPSQTAREAAAHAGLAITWSTLEAAVDDSTRYDLEAEVDVHDSQVEIIFRYRRDMFSAKLIGGFLRRFMELTEAVVASPDLSLPGLRTMSLR